MATSGALSTNDSLADAARQRRLSILEAGLPLDPVAPPTGRGGETKDRILDTAISFFGERGFEACTMRDLATAVGIKAPAIYNHFGSKEEVLSAAIEHILGRFFSSLLLPLPENHPERWLEPLVKEHVEFQLRNRELAFANHALLNAQLKNRVLPRPVHTRIVGIERSYVELIGVLVRLASPGRDARDSLMSGFAVTAMCNGVVAWYDPGGEMSVEEVAERSWGLARRMIGEEG